MEIGITGGEEDGVDNTGMDQNKLYTQPEQVSFFFACVFVEQPGLKKHS